MSGLSKRSFTLSGHRTSVALEPEFWDALSTLAIGDGRSLAGLVAHIDSQRAGETAAKRPLASALRVYALVRCREG